MKNSNEGRESPLTINEPREQQWLLRIEDVIQRLGICRRTLEREISRGRFPRPLKIGTRSRWEVGDVVGYIERLVRERSPEAAPS